MAKRARGAQTVTEYPIARNNTTGNPGIWHSVPRALSRMNHRLYRDQMNYYLNVRLNTTVQTGASPILVYALAPTWYVQGALRAAKTMHDRAMKDERQTVQQARWYDYRTNLDFDGAVYEEAFAYGVRKEQDQVVIHTADELNHSLVLDANDAARCFTLRQATGTNVGGGVLAYNVFEEYDAMADTPIDNPAVTAGVNPYDDLLEEADTENMEFLQKRGDLPPYNGDSFDAVWVQVGELYNDATGAQSLATGVFQAPLGVFFCTGAGAGISGGAIQTDVPRVTVEVVPGTYKGVHADAL